MASADFDSDGDIEILFATEDDATNEFYLNQGGNFTDVSERITVGGKSNASAIIDANNDGHLDIIIGNDGVNFLLINDGNANFTQDTDSIDFSNETTQDVEVADIDGDGDLDIVAGNENLNKIYINNGDGTFTDESDTRLEDISAETRDVELGDVDGDGDLDILVSNVDYFGAFPDDNYLLFNDGSGNFERGELTAIIGPHTDSDLVDIDNDGDLDIVTGTAHLADAVGSNAMYLNDGNGVFTPTSLAGSGNVFDVIAADFTGDGKLDLYFCNRKIPFAAPGFEGGQDLYFTQD